MQTLDLTSDTLKITPDYYFFFLLVTSSKHIERLSISSIQDFLNFYLQFGRRGWNKVELIFLPFRLATQVVRKCLRAIRSHQKMAAGTLLLDGSVVPGIGDLWILENSIWEGLKVQTYYNTPSCIMNGIFLSKLFHVFIQNRWLYFQNCQRQTPASQLPYFRLSYIWVR